VDLRAGLDILAKRRNPITAPSGNWNPRHPAHSLVIILTKLPHLITMCTVLTKWSLITLYWATVPDWRSDSMFPGSRYAILMRKPGPVKAHKIRKLNPVWKQYNVAWRKKEWINTLWVRPKQHYNFIVHTLSVSGIWTLCSLKYVCFADGDRTVFSVATDEGVLGTPGVMTWHLPSLASPVLLSIVQLVWLSET
jgi:hypothetical protein